MFSHLKTKGARARKKRPEVFRSRVQEEGVREHDVAGFAARLDDGGRVQTVADAPSRELRELGGRDARLPPPT